MSIGFIIVCVFILLLVYILVFPITFKIDTLIKKYYINLPGIVKFALILRNNDFLFKLSILFISFKIDPFKKKSTKKTEIPELFKPKKSGKRKFKLKNLVLGQKILSAIRIKVLKCSIDTGDYPLNAQLIPVVSQFNTTNRQIKINFNETNYLIFKANVSIFMILYTMIKFYLVNR